MSEFGGDIGGDFGGDFGGDIGSEYGGDFGDESGGDWGGDIYSNYGGDNYVDIESDYGESYDAEYIPENFPADWDAYASEYESYATDSWSAAEPDANFPYDNPDFNSSLTPVELDSDTSLSDTSSLSENVLEDYSEDFIIPDDDLNQIATEPDTVFTEASGSDISTLEKDEDEETLESLYTNFEQPVDLSANEQTSEENGTNEFISELDNAFSEPATSEIDFQENENISEIVEDFGSDFSSIEEYSTGLEGEATKELIPDFEIVEYSPETRDESVEVENPETEDIQAVNMEYLNELISDSTAETIQSNSAESEDQSLSEVNESQGQSEVENILAQADQIEQIEPEIDSDAQVETADDNEYREVHELVESGEVEISPKGDFETAEGHNSLPSNYEEGEKTSQNDLPNKQEYEEYQGYPDKILFSDTQNEPGQMGDWREEGSVAPETNEYPTEYENQTHDPQDEDNETGSDAEVASVFSDNIMEQPGGGELGDSSETGEEPPITEIAPEDKGQSKILESTSEKEKSEDADNENQELLLESEKEDLSEEKKKTINYQYHNDVYSFDLEDEPDLFEKYPDGVKFDDDGYPDFSPYAIKSVEIDMKGNYTTDYDEANKAAGLDEKPEGYTWHHSQDCKTMLLIPTDLHSAVRHTGGVSLLK